MAATEDPAADRLAELIREAHAATKDLRAATRDARQVAGTLADEQIAARLQAELDAQLHGLAARVQEATEDAVSQVRADFDRFGEALLGKEAYWARAASAARAAASPPDGAAVAAAAEGPLRDGA